MRNNVLTLPNAMILLGNVSNNGIQSGLALAAVSVELRLEAYHVCHGE